MPCENTIRHTPKGTPTRLLHVAGRVAFGAPFILLGLDAAKEPGARVKAVEALGIPQPEHAVCDGSAESAAGGVRRPAGDARACGRQSVAVSSSPAGSSPGSWSRR